MRYFVNDLKGDRFEYKVQQKNLHDRNFREVEPNVFKGILAMNGINYELSEDKIKSLENENSYLVQADIEKAIQIENLEIENANFLIDSAEKDLKIILLEQENANILLENLNKEIRLTQAEEDLAGVLLLLGGI